MIFTLCLLAVNATLMGWKADSEATRSEPGIRVAAERGALLSVANILPLCLGGRTNPLVNLVGIRLGSYHFAHQVFGAIATVQGIFHLVVAVATRSYEVPRSLPSGIPVRKIRFHK